ncbi:MAG TPA: hypothetical protein VM639_16790 [Dongiaceae bacterium]|nr:hypothetical protein [Dongiaceae bacterium]
MPSWPRFARLAVARMLTVCSLALAGLGIAGSTARAQQDLTDTPVTAPLSQRFVLIVLDQPDRDLSHGSTKLNMMYDTKTGRSWVLQYTVKPGSNEQGYVWSEVPYAAPPK